MVNYFFLENRMVKMASGDSSAGPNIFWIDLISATDEEKHRVERGRWTPTSGPHAAHHRGEAR